MTTARSMRYLCDPDPEKQIIRKECAIFEIDEMLWISVDFGTNHELGPQRKCRTTSEVRKIVLIPRKISKFEERNKRSPSRRQRVRREPILQPRSAKCGSRGVHPAAMSLVCVGRVDCRSVIGGGGGVGVGVAGGRTPMSIGQCSRFFASEDTARPLLSTAAAPLPNDTPHHRTHYPSSLHLFCSSGLSSGTMYFTTRYWHSFMNGNNQRNGDGRSHGRQGGRREVTKRIQEIVLSFSISI